jgi:hypothetical protein
VRRESAALRHGDPLEVTALAVSGPADSMVVLAADLAGMDTDFSDRVRGEVAEAVGCDASQVLINCSHSHAAPWARARGGKLGGGSDETTRTEMAYFERLPFDFASAAVQAWNSRQEARVSGGVGRVPGIAVNRRERWQGTTILGWNRDGYVADSVPVIRVDSLLGEPIATVVAFGCHPVVVGPDVAATGTDFVGPLRRRVELLRGGHCLFLQGAAGNVLPLEGFFECDGPQSLMGERIALEAVHAVVDADPLRRDVERIPFGSVTPIALYRRSIVAEQPRQGVQVVSTLVDLPLLPAPRSADLSTERELRARELAAADAASAPRSVTNPIRYHLNWLDSMLARAPLDDWTHSAGEVWASRIGPCAIVGLPGEVFSEIGAAVRKASPFPTTLVAGYSQGILGYVATASEHAYGGYEPSVSHRGYDHPSPFAPEAEDLLVGAATTLLGQLAERDSGVSG